MPHWPHGDPRDVVAALLRDPRFAHDAAKPSPTWFDVLREALQRIAPALLRIVDRLLGHASGVERATGIAVVVVLGGLLALAVFFIVRVVARAAPGGRRAARSDESAAAPTAAGLHASAAAAARAGRLREAAALFFAAAQRALDESGRVPYDAARTPGEYRRLVGEPGFDAFARDAIVALFARAEPSPDLVARMSGAYAALFGSPPA